MGRGRFCPRQSAAAQECLRFERLFMAGTWRVPHLCEIHKRQLFLASSECPQHPRIPESITAGLIGALSVINPVPVCMGVLQMATGILCLSEMEMIQNLARPIIIYVFKYSLLLSHLVASRFGQIFTPRAQH